MNDEEKKPSDNAAKVRAVTLAIARTPVMFGAHGPIEMFRNMAIHVLDNTKGANDVEDELSKEYDGFLKQLAEEEKKRKGWR